MMKKILTLLCALCLLAGTFSAQAEDPTAIDISAVYMLASISAEGETAYLGTAALLGDQSTLVTTRWAAETETDLYAIGEGGTLAVIGSKLLCEGSSLVALTLASPSPAKPLALGATDESMTCVAAVDGKTVTRAAEHVLLTGYEGDAALLYIGIHSAQPGALLLNSQGELAGITAAGYGEGLNRYVAYPAQVIQARMNGESPASADKIAQVEFIAGVNLVTDLGEMVVDWSHLDAPENADDSSFYLIWQDTGNSYVSYAHVDWAEGSASFGYVPGRSYRVWVQQSMSGEVDMTTLTLEGAQMIEAAVMPAFSDHAYRDTAMYLAAAPVNVSPEATEVIPAVETFTLESLTDADTCYYLQAISTYQVEEENHAALVLAIIAPDGSVYSDMGGFVFMPELNENDTWHADVTELLRDCMQFTGGASGEYTLAYYLDGQLATEFCFTVE